jgi:hypothetical protein
VVEGVVGVSVDAIEEHEEIGELGMFVSVGVALVSAIALGLFWKRPLVGWITRLFLLAGLVTFGILGYAGWLGGRIHHEEIRPESAPAVGFSADRLTHPSPQGFPK